MLLKEKKEKSRRKVVPLWVLAVGTLTGCVSSQYLEAAREVSSINQHASVEYLAKSLQADTENKDAVNMLNTTLSAIRYDYDSRLRQYKKNNNYDLAVAECDRMIATAHLIRGIPGRQWELNFKPEERLVIANRAAENYYQKGKKFYEEKRFQESVTSFDRANGFVPEYKNAKELRDKIINLAVHKVYMKAVIVTKVRNNKGDNIVKDVTEKVTPFLIEKAPRFIKLVNDPREASHICEIKVKSANFYDTGVSYKKGENSYEVKEKVDGEKKKVTKKANWEHYTHTTSLKLFANFDIKDAKTGNIARSATSEVEKNSTAEWVVYNGDQGALPSKLRKLPNSEVYPSNKETLSQYCAEEVAEQLAHKLFLLYK